MGVRARQISIPLRSITIAVMLLTALLLTGCKTYEAGFARSYQYGQYDVAQAQLKREAGGALDREGNRDHLIYLLEQGAIERTRGDLDASNQALDRADEYFQKLDQKATVRVARSARAAVSNLAELDYEGHGYDRIMMNLYKSLNYMEQGNLDFARAELKRLAYAQQQIEQRKAQRIRELQEQGSSGNSARAASDPALAAKTERLYASIPDNSIKAAYVNAFAEYLQGIFLLHAGDADDREVGRAAIRSALSMAPNSYIQQDLLWSELPRDEQYPVTYVILESGVAPMRQEVRIDIPIWFFNIAINDTGVDYVGVAFPELVPQPGGVGQLHARAESRVYPTQLLVDMDGVIAREFKDELPTVITRTIIAAGVKAGVAYAAHRATRDDPLLNLVTRIATTAYQYNVNNADLRTWRTLPKTISVARLPTPADGNVTLLSPVGTTIAQVKVNPGVSSVIWVRAPGDAGSVVCRAFNLDPNMKPDSGQVISRN